MLKLFPEGISGRSSRASAKLTSLVSSPVFPCLPFINMHKGRVNDVIYCDNLEKNAFLHTNEVPSSIYNEVDRFTNERHSTTIGTIGLPRLALALLT